MGSYDNFRGIMWGHCGGQYNNFGGTSGSYDNFRGITWVVMGSL